MARIRQYLQSVRVRNIESNPAVTLGGYASRPLLDDLLEARPQFIIFILAPRFSDYQDFVLDRLFE